MNRLNYDYDYEDYVFDEYETQDYETGECVELLSIEDCSFEIYELNVGIDFSKEFCVNEEN